MHPRRDVTKVRSRRALAYAAGISRSETMNAEIVALGEPLDRCSIKLAATQIRTRICKASGGDTSNNGDRARRDSRARAGYHYPRRR
jgi:hypothetical protein